MLVLLGATITAGLAARRAGRAEAGEVPRGIAVSAWLVTFLIAVFGVVIWLMATKPA